MLKIIFNYIEYLYNQNPLNFITLIVIFLYTLFTYLLWRESVGQAGLHLLPIPAIYIRGKNSKDVFRIRNLGEKPMINVEIEDWNLITNFGKIIDKYRLTFLIPYPNIIKPDEERNLETKTYFGREISQNIAPFLNPQYNSISVIPLKMAYQDIRGQRYKARFAFGKGELSLISLPKKISRPRLIFEHLLDSIINCFKYLFFVIRIKIKVFLNKKLKRFRGTILF